MFFLRRPAPDVIDRVLADARRAQPTFPHVGATRSSERINGFRFDTYSGVVGHGVADFHAASDGLRVWAAHVGAGVTVTPPTEPLVAGATIVASTNVAPFHVLIPCRVVYVVEEAREFGFAYATLPGHPESGEERFVVALDAADSVVFTVSAHSRHAELLARLGAPVSRIVQRRTNNGYVAALSSFVERHHH